VGAGGEEEGCGEGEAEAFQLADRDEWWGLEKVAVVSG
jgi:hypothetical protein